MQQKVQVREKLTIFVYDKEGNLIKHEVYKPPKNKLEEIAAKLGILKRANTVNNTGFNICAKRWVGVTMDPVRWIAAKNSADTWWFRSTEASVVGNNAIIKNPDSAWIWEGALTGYYKSIGAATSNHENWIVSEISNIDVKIHDGRYWAELEYDFT